MPMSPIELSSFSAALGETRTATSRVAAVGTRARFCEIPQRKVVDLETGKTLRD